VHHFFEFTQNRGYNGAKYDFYEKDHNRDNFFHEELVTNHTNLVRRSSQTFPLSVSSSPPATLSNSPGTDVPTD